MLIARYFHYSKKIDDINHNEYSYGDVHVHVHTILIVCVQFCRRGSVIVKDSNQAEWVYVVKSVSY